MKAYGGDDRRFRPTASVRLSGWVPAAAFLLIMTTSCTGSASGDGAAAALKPGSAGVGDRLFPALGNGGYDVAHYGLTRLRTGPPHGDAIVQSEGCSSHPRGGRSRGHLPDA